MAAGLGISIGSATLVAVTDGSTGETQQVRLPSALQLDDGSVITGFVERVGDPIPILAADGTEYRGEALAATAVGALVGQADGDEATTVVLAHPVAWNRHTTRTMESALDDAGVHGATLVAEPAAVMAWLAASGTAVNDGLTVVYDLGARSLDVTMMSTTGGRSEIFGKPLRSEDIGGDEFDHLVTVHLLDAVSDHFATLDPFAPETIAALETLRENARAAKEELSTETETVARVALPGALSDIRLVRSELEDLIRPALTESVALVRESLRSAGVESSDVNQVVLAGGSSSIPLVAELLSAELRVPVIADADPASCAASGAAALALDARDSHVPAAATAVIPVEPSRKPAPVPTFSTPLIAEPTEEENTATRRSSRVGVVAAVVGAFIVLAAGGLGIGTAMDRINIPSSSANTTNESTSSTASTTPGSTPGSTTAAEAAGTGSTTANNGTQNNQPGSPAAAAGSTTAPGAVPVAGAPVGSAPAPGETAQSAPAPAAPGAPAPAPAPAPGPAPAPAPAPGAGVGTGIGDAATGIGNGVGGLVDGVGNGVGGVVGGLGNVVGGVGNVVGGVVGGVTAPIR